jgi:hypothetical protein
MIGWRKGRWPHRKGGTILPTAKPHRGTVSFEQIGRAIGWLTAPWRRK